MWWGCGDRCCFVLCCAILAGVRQADHRPVLPSDPWSGADCYDTDWTPHPWAFDGSSCGSDASLSWLSPGRCMSRIPRAHVKLSGLDRLRLRSYDWTLPFNAGPTSPSYGTTAVQPSPAVDHASVHRFVTFVSPAPSSSLAPGLDANPCTDSVRCVWRTRFGPHTHHMHAHTPASGEWQVVCVGNLSSAKFACGSESVVRLFATVGSAFAVRFVCGTVAPDLCVLCRWLRDSSVAAGV
jgi:hypothetical protein